MYWTHIGWDESVYSDPRYTDDNWRSFKCRCGTQISGIFVGMQGTKIRLVKVDAITSTCYTWHFPSYELDVSEIEGYKPADGTCGPVIDELRLK